LVINNLYDSKTITVNSTGILTGYGSLKGQITLNSGGYVAPNLGFNAAALTWNGGGIIVQGVGTTTTVLNLTGAFRVGTLGGNYFSFQNNDIRPNEPYLIIRFANTTFNGVGTFVGSEMDFGNGLVKAVFTLASTALFVEWPDLNPLKPGKIINLVPLPQIPVNVPDNVLNPILDLPPGTTTINGTLQSPIVNVPVGSFLNGAGTVLGNLYNSGTVMPGDAPGIIHVTGSYTQTSTGLLQIQIGGRGINQYSLLSVDGSASLGGILQLIPVSGYKLRLNQPVTLLTAGGGVIGKFGSVADGFLTGDILIPTVIYHPTSVALEARQGSFAQFAEGVHLPPNERAVAGALDSVASNRLAGSLFNFLDNQSFAKLPRDLDRISPEGLTSIFTIGRSYSQLQAMNIQRRTDELRTGTNGFSAANFAFNGQNPSYNGGFDFTTGTAGPSGDGGKEVKETKEQAPSEDRWGAFLSGTVEWINVSGTDDARGYDLTSGGFTLGVDYKVTPNFAIGLIAGYVGTTSDLTDHDVLGFGGGVLRKVAESAREPEECGDGNRSVAAGARCVAQ
jgi:hypothetical protein